MCVRTHSAAQPTARVDHVVTPAGTLGFMGAEDQAPRGISDTDRAA
jgi:hypothetical protein